MSLKPISAVAKQKVNWISITFCLCDKKYSPMKYTDMYRRNFIAFSEAFQHGAKLVKHGLYKHTDHQASQG